ncbi:YpbF family protein [Peribacillus frigoritolerans]|uniref:YpbF family protein n=1 Tax=Peribacillus frigoritolerans TaxID=450367 RepID=UPI003D08A8AB
MESTIILLDEKTDQATKQMLQNVVDRKKKFEALKKKHLQSLWATMIVAVLFMIYLYFYIVVPYSYSFFSMFSVFVDQFSHFLFLAAAIGLYGYMVLIKKKLDKAEKEFQLLRCEIINKSKQLWEKEEEWKNRHKVFEMMKKNYDINLYHENK